jgi:hypothetical protein
MEIIAAGRPSSGQCSNNNIKLLLPSIVVSRYYSCSKRPAVIVIIMPVCSFIFMLTGTELYIQSCYL